MLPHIRRRGRACEELIGRLHELDFEVDGLVLKVNRFEQRERAGQHGQKPALGGGIQVRKVRGGRRGSTASACRSASPCAIHTVADLEPVELAGTTVSGPACTMPKRSATQGHPRRRHRRCGESGQGHPAHRPRREATCGRRSWQSSIFPSVALSAASSRQGRRGRLHPLSQRCIARPRSRSGSGIHASRNAMDIEGCGDKLVDQLVADGLVNSYGRFVPTDARAAYRAGADGGEKIIRECFGGGSPPARAAA